MRCSLSKAYFSSEDTSRSFPSDATRQYVQSQNRLTYDCV
nr:MAG TPA: hypothetical protein [Caudoviricetes sp.]